MWLSHRRGRAQTHGRRDGAGPSSGWLGDRQRACPRVEAGETDAAEPGQAETGPADQATNEHARIEEGQAHTLARGQRQNRHGRGMPLIYRIDRTRVPVTQRGVSNNQCEGWGSNLALFITEGFISARSDVPHAEEITPMTQKMRPKLMPKLR